MTAMEFNRKYPDGLKKVIYQFQKAAYEVIKGEEIDCLINMTRGADKKALKAIKEWGKKIDNWSDIHYLMLMPEAPQILLGDIMVYMVMHDDEVVRGEDVED